MREIKFRAWDTEQNKFFEHVFDASNGKLLDLTITFSGALIRRTMAKHSEHESMFPDRYILNQYIGIKDQSGTEIYEGDIVESIGNKDMFGEVVFKGTCFGVTMRGKSNKDVDNGEFMSMYRLKIIGNIYHDPELIKE